MYKHSENTETYTGIRTEYLKITGQNSKEEVKSTQNKILVQNY